MLTDPNLRSINTESVRASVNYCIIPGKHMALSEFEKEDREESRPKSPMSGIWVTESKIKAWKFLK